MPHLLKHFLPSFFILLITFIFFSLSETVSSLALLFFGFLFLTGTLFYFHTRTWKKNKIRHELLDKSLAEFKKGKLVQFEINFDDDVYNQIVLAFNSFTIDHEERMEQIEAEKKQLLTILNSMMEGVLVTNNSLNVLMINPAMKQMFHIPNPKEGGTVLEVTRHVALNEALAAVIQTKTSVRKNIVLQEFTKEKHIFIHASPLLIDEELVGTVCILMDESELRKLETIRRDFIANVSHELKTPLTSIRGYAETLLLDGTLNDEKTSKKFVEKIDSNAKHLQELVEDILELSAIESGRISIKPSLIYLKKFFDEIQSQFSLLLSTNEMQLVIDVDEGLHITTDVKSFSQILRNLVDNAIKYSSKGSKVFIRAEREGNQIRVTVQDQGIGIQKQELDRIFERFYRVDKARSKASGTGLGLAIVKHLVSLLKGQMQVESTAGEGTTFILRFPSH